MVGIDRYKYHSFDHHHHHHRQHSEGAYRHNWKEETKIPKFAWLLTNDDEVTIQVVLTIPIASNRTLLHMMVGKYWHKYYSFDHHHRQHSEVVYRHN